MPAQTRYFDEHVVEPHMGRWQDFLDELRLSFEDKNLQRKAHEKLEHFRQGTWRTNEFFAVFDSLLNDAEIVSDDEKILLVECNVKAELVDMVYSSGMVPTMYIIYRAHLLMIRRLWEQWQEQKALDRRGLLPLAVWQRREETPCCQEPHRPDPQPTTNCTMATSMTFRGHSHPMDLDAMR
jgi:hypothetical protein